MTKKAVKPTSKTTIGKTSGPVNNYLGRTGNDRDEMYVAENRRQFAGETLRMQWDAERKGMFVDAGDFRKGKVARYVSPVIKCRFPATEFLPSWNIALSGKDQGFRVYLRFHSKDVSRPSAWMMVGERGKIDLKEKVVVKAPGWGQTRVDYIALRRSANAFQYKVEFWTTSARPTAADQTPGIVRFFVHYSGPGAAGKAVKAPAFRKPAKDFHLPVPYRSQLDVPDDALKNIVCCPTSLSMVMEYHGKDHPTIDVVHAIYCKRNNMHGVWPNASQLAYENGFRACVTRFRSHQDLQQYIKTTGNPVIVSIRVAEGELRRAAYPKSNGHIIVVTGMRKNGDYIVNDPYSVGPGGAEIDYISEDMAKVWLDKGGVAVLVEKQQS